MFSKPLSTLRTKGLDAASLRAGEEGAEGGLVMSARRWISDVCQEGGAVAFTEQAFAKDEGLTRDAAAAAELGLGARSSDPHLQSPAFIQG